MTDTIPPRPEGPSEVEALRQVVAFADEAVALSARASQPFGGLRAEGAFYRSWLALARHMLDETLEGENRAQAWDRVEELEGKLGEIRVILDDFGTLSMTGVLRQKIREVLDR